MSTAEAEVVEAFQSIGIAPDLALKAAVALHQHDSVVDERLARRDVQIAAMISDLAAVKADVLLLKWMMGFMLSINLAILLKLLLH